MVTIERFLRLCLTWVGARLPASLVWKICMIGNYVHAGWWMRQRQFSCATRWRSREELIEAIARPLADKQVLYLEFGVFQGGSMRQMGQVAYE